MSSAGARSLTLTVLPRRTPPAAARGPGLGYSAVRQVHRGWACWAHCIQYMYTAKTGPGAVQSELSGSLRIWHINIGLMSHISHLTSHMYYNSLPVRFYHQSYKHFSGSFRGRPPPGEGEEGGVLDLRRNAYGNGEERKVVDLRSGPADGGRRAAPQTGQRGGGGLSLKLAARWCCGRQHGEATQRASTSLHFNMDWRRVGCQPIDWHHVAFNSDAMCRGSKPV